ncbi:MAG: hypothetical protein NZ550_01320 [Fimbriimonadales bacterium]|nr:hypothetical protein [Fimbriimonadales bacterium]
MASAPSLADGTMPSCRSIGVSPTPRAIGPTGVSFTCRGNGFSRSKGKVQ